MSYTWASHQGALDMFWLHFWSSDVIFIFKYSQFLHLTLQVFPFPFGRESEMYVEVVLLSLKSLKHHRNKKSKCVALYCLGDQSTNIYEIFKGILQFWRNCFFPRSQTTSWIPFYVSAGCLKICKKKYLLKLLKLVPTY